MMDVNTIFGLAGMGFTLLLIALVVVIIVALIKVWQTKVKTSKEGGYQKQIAEAIQMQREYHPTYSLFDILISLPVPVAKYVWQFGIATLSFCSFR